MAAHALTLDPQDLQARPPLSASALGTPSSCTASKSPFPRINGPFVVQALACTF
jgi:hypothetical protein